MADSFVLVTGAAGFVGSRLTEILLESGQNVVALDCFLPDLYSADIKKRRWDKLSHRGSAKLEKVIIDLRSDDLEVLKQFPITSIFNQAAMPGLISDWSKFAPYYECNLSALNRLLEFSRTVELKSFVQASTSSVYGLSAIGNEQQETQPTSPYGVSKLAAEKLLIAYNHWYQIPVKILRYFSIYGPKQRPDMAYARIISALQQGSVFTIHGNGDQQRSNTYIDDVVNATILADAKALPGEVINICGDETVSLNFVIHTLEELSGKTLNILFDNKRTGDQIITSGNNNLAKNRLGWSCKTNIRDGLQMQLSAHSVL